MKLKWFVLALCIVLLIPVIVSAQVKVGYDGELLIGKPYFVAVDHEGKIYTSQKNGTITIMDSKGKVLSIFGGKDKKWKNILKGPRGIAFYATPTALYTYGHKSRPSTAWIPMPIPAPPL